jgi:hypothetical protein
MSLFPDGLLAGFECSAHRRMDGVRVDVLASTHHDILAEGDYRLLNEYDIHIARDGVRWHRIEFEPGRYDWAVFRSMLRAGEKTGIQVVWDLCHYDYPDHVSPWSPEFPERFADFARRLAEIVRDESNTLPIYCPINEISFMSWACGETASMNPGGTGRGDELKEQLARASIFATRSIKSIDPRARFLSSEPIIHVVAAQAKDADAADAYTQSQYEAADWVLGMGRSHLGGSSDCIDVIGVNFYPSNQWFLKGGIIPMGHHKYLPLRNMLREVSERYPGKEVIISKTGAEGSARSAWLHYVCEEVDAARSFGVPVTGICIYPVLDYPGWENSRPCEVGLFSGGVERSVHAQFLAELRRQQARTPKQTPLRSFA